MIGWLLLAAALVLGVPAVAFLAQDRMLFLPQLDAIARASGIRAPLLAIAGERDAVVPPGRSRWLYDAWGGPKRWVVIPEANHGLRRQRSFWEPILAFLDAARAS